MADPGDPTKTGDDFDDEIGFCSADSIAGRSVDDRVHDQSEVQAEVQAEAQVSGQAPTSDPEPVSGWDSPETQAQPAWTSSTDAADMTQAAPIMASDAYMTRAERLDALHAEPRERLTWALTLYALILFAVPTMGFSAVIGLLAVTGRAVDASDLLQSHYIYQKRTLWTAAIAVLAGLILIVVNLGVFVLFLTAVWTLVRGASGLWRLKSGRPISNPQSWFF